MMKMKMTMTKWPEAEGINPEKIRALHKLVASGEGEQLEFKRKTSYPDKIVCEMIAFANTHGGTLLIGVSDDGSIPGVKYPDEEIFSVEQALRKYCRPSIKAIRSTIPIAQHRYVVQYTIKESKRKPHAFIDSSGNKTVYVRYQDKTTQASREMIEIIKRLHYKKSVKLQYRENENLLMKYLAQHAYITFDHYRTITGLNRYKASRSLVVLVLANILQIIPTEKGDRYTLHPSFH
jgi:predicted HTH transcriptional regulator